MVEHGVRYVRGAEYCETRDYDANDANRIQYAVMHHLGRTEKDVVFQGLIEGLGLNTTTTRIKKNRVKWNISSIEKFNLLK